MANLKPFLRRLQTLWRSEQLYKEIAEEMRFHIDQRTADNIRRGMPSAEARKEAEQRFGKETLGPWSDFEWGMLSGKLSALRWVLGDDWDNMDT